MDQSTFAEAPGKGFSFQRISKHSPLEVSELESIPIKQSNSPLMTPPSRNVFSPLPTSPSLRSSPDPPEFRLFEHFQRRITILRSFSRWRSEYMQKKRRSETYHELVSSPSFDILARVASIEESRQRFLQRKVFHALRIALISAKRAKIASSALNKRLLTKTLWRWQKHYIANSRKHIAAAEASVSSVESAQDMIGQLHSLVATNAELETRLDEVNSEVRDISSLICDTRLNQNELQNSVQQAIQEYEKIKALYHSVEASYKEQIGSLRISIRDTSESSKQKVSVLKERMDRLSSSPSSDSVDHKKVDIESIRNKLKETFSTTVYLRKELANSQAAQESLIKEIAPLVQAKTEIKQLCEATEQKAKTESKESLERLSHLRSLYEQAKESLDKANNKVREGRDELADLDITIDGLTRELEISRQRARSAIEAFGD